MAPDVFIGLVTHPGSRFPDARTDSGLTARLAGELRECGFAVETAIIDEDSAEAQGLALDVASIRASIREELRIERRWREYLTGKPASLALRTLLRFRELWRTLTFTPPWRRSPHDSGIRRVTRLANIELAHMQILSKAIDSGAPWAFILEDDAHVDEPRKLAHEVARLIREIADIAPNLAMVNLSESFSTAQLGIEHLLEPSERDTRPWTMVRAQRHVTNTVCAVLYRRDLLIRLHQELEAIALEPVVPIDFKINEAIVRVGSDLPGETWVCTPAPITQGSGVPVVRVAITR